MALGKAYVVPLWSYPIGSSEVPVVYIGFTTLDRRNTRCLHEKMWDRNEQKGTTPS